MALPVTRVKVTCGCFTLALLLVLVSCYSYHLGIVTHDTREGSQWNTREEVTRIVQDQQIKVECNEECQWLTHQKSRRGILRRKCENLGLETSLTEEWLEKNQNRLQNLIYSDKYRVIFCYIPKVACTTWKLAFQIMNGHLDLEDVRSSPDVPDVHTMLYGQAQGTFFNTRRNRTTMSVKQMLNKLKNYRSFVMVRDPFSRSLSAFTHKFNGHLTKEEKKTHRIYGRPIHQKYGSDNHGNHETDQDHVTFQEFVKYLGDPTVMINPSSYEQHWAPMNDLCLPCAVNYDYIAKLENFQTDTKFMLDQVGAPHLFDIVVGTRPHSTNSSDNRIFNKFYSDLTSEDVEGLRWRYDADFKLFEYSEDI